MENDGSKDLHISGTEALAHEITFKPRKFRCPKGHEWESFAAHELFYFTDDKGVDHRSGPNCPICVVEFFRQFPAEEVK